MKCKINVLEENEKVKIVGMKPTMISQFFSEVSKKEAEEVEKDIKEIDLHTYLNRFRLFLVVSD